MISFAPPPPAPGAAEIAGLRLTSVLSSPLTQRSRLEPVPPFAPSPITHLGRIVGSYGRFNALSSLALSPCRYMHPRRECFPSFSESGIVYPVVGTSRLDM